MKILFLTQVLPYPPDSGPKVKTWNVLKSLTQAGSTHHQVTLVSFVRGDQSQDVRCLEQVCQKVYTVPMQRGSLRDLVSLARSFLTRKPFLIERDDRPAMRRLVDDLAQKEQFDIVHTDQLNMAQYALRVDGPGLILDAHNALWLLYQRLWKTMPPGPKKWLLGRDWRLLKGYEGWICRQFDATIAVSQEDWAALEDAARGSLPGTVIPIAVDTEEITPVERGPSASHILHIGTMFWPPNVDGVLWFLREILPIIHRNHPGIQIDLLGASPPKEITDFAQEGSGIHVPGYVVDPSPYLQQAAVMVVPLRAGGGMRVKILNGLAHGLPVVSTSLGAEGIHLEHGKHILLADTPEDFARCVVQLLEDRSMADELGKNGRQLIETNYDYRGVGRQLEALYTNLAGLSPKSRKSGFTKALTNLAGSPAKELNR